MSIPTESQRRVRTIEFRISSTPADEKTRERGGKEKENGGTDLQKYRSVMELQQMSTMSSKCLEAVEKEDKIKFFTL